MATWAEADRQLDRSARWVFADVALTGPVPVDHGRVAPQRRLRRPVRGDRGRRLAPRAQPHPDASDSAAGRRCRHCSSRPRSTSRSAPASGRQQRSAGRSVLRLRSGHHPTDRVSVADRGRVCRRAVGRDRVGGPGDPTRSRPSSGSCCSAAVGSSPTSIRTEPDRAERLHAGLEKLEADQVAVARQAEADERARIARELHDAVGHAVNVIVLQAGAARLTATATVRTRRACSAHRTRRPQPRWPTSTTCSACCARPSDDGPLGPARTVDDIVDSSTRCAPRCQHRTRQPLPICDDSIWRTGAAAYRIVQESLTNAIKHAGDAQITVTMSCTNDRFPISSSSTTVSAARGGTVGGGRGIPGMVERGQVLGGQLTAGPPTRRWIRRRRHAPEVARRARRTARRCAEADAS